MLCLNCDDVGRHAAALVRDDAVVLIVLLLIVIAGIGKNDCLQCCCLCAGMLVEAVFVGRVVRDSNIAADCLLVPLIAQVRTACLHLECGIALRHIKISGGVGLACVVGRLAEDVWLAVGSYLNVWNGDDAHPVVADFAVHLSRSVGVCAGVGRSQGDGRSLGMDGFVQGDAAVLADIPVSVGVFPPSCAHVEVLAFCVVLTEFEALVVLVAPMLGKFVALDAEVVVAAYRRRVVGAAVEAELADVATLFTFVAVAALVADEVAAEVVVALRADVVLAMFAAILAEAAVFAELALVEAFAAIRTDVVVPVGTVGTELVLAVIVCLTIETQAAVLAFFILRACSALGAEMVFVVGGSDAVAMFAALRLAVAVAAFFAKFTIRAKVEAGSFCALAALRTLPVVLFAAMYAMLAAKLTPD